MKQTDQLLQLIVPAPQKTLLVDFLLAQETVPFFTVIEAAGFGQPHEHLTGEEQVEGAQHKVKFEIELAADEVEPLLNGIRQALPTLNVFYRVLPVVAQGDLHRGSP